MFYFVKVIRLTSIVKTILLAFIAFFMLQTAWGESSTLKITTPQKIAIDPGRVKRIIAPKKRPFDLTVPITKKIKKIVAEPEKDLDKFKLKLSEIVFSGNTVYKKRELYKYYKQYLNKDLSLSDLQIIAASITVHYRKNGYVISKAIIPPQKIEEGKVHIKIIEGYVAEVYVEGGTKRFQNQIRKYSKKIKQMRPLQEKKLERYMLLINDIPGVVAKTVLSPSTSKVGAADITIIVEQKRILGEIYHDNRGSQYMGPQQTVMSGSVNDFIAAADSLTLQTIFTPFHGELRYNQVSYSFPLGINGLRMSIDANLTETSPGFILNDFNIIGRGKNWGVNLDYPLLRTRTKNFWLYSKFDWLDTYSNIPASTLFRDQIRSIRVGATYDFVDNLRGINLVNMEFSKGLYIFNATPYSPKIPASRFGGLSNYKKINMNFSRYQSLGKRWMLLGEISSQYSFRNPLLSSEEFSFGGQQFGRAYDPSEIVGDSGVNGKVELRLNTYHDLKFLHQIQYYTFYEIGIMWNIGEDFTQPSKLTAINLGGGLKASLNEYFYGNIELAKPLTKDVSTRLVSGSSGKAWRIYFGLGVNL